MPTPSQIKSACPTLFSRVPDSELSALVELLREPVREVYTREAAAKVLGVNQSTLWRWAQRGGVFVPGRDDRGEITYTRQQLDYIVAVCAGKKSKADADAEWALVAGIAAAPTVRQRKRKEQRHA